MEAVTTSILTAVELLNFTGTEEWFRHGLVRRVLFTEGVKYVADRAGAYWLIDEIATAQLLPVVASEDFQLWTLTVTPVDGRTPATLVCDDGNGNIVYQKDITFTDFPLAQIKFYCTNNVICLPSEN